MLPVNNQYKVFFSTVRNINSYCVDEKRFRDPVFQHGLDQAEGFLLGGHTTADLCLHLGFPAGETQSYEFTSKLLQS